MYYTTKSKLKKISQWTLTINLYCLAYFYIKIATCKIINVYTWEIKNYIKINTSSFGSDFVLSIDVFH